MAGVKISNLPELTVLTSNDLFVVVDAETNETKHISKANALIEVTKLQATASSHEVTIGNHTTTLTDHGNRITTLEAAPQGQWTASGVDIGRNSDVSVTGSFTVDGIIYATEKHFYIDHPTKKNKKLVYGALEGPENGVYIRGSLIDSNEIELPEYWSKLVDIDTISVNLTSIGKDQKLFVDRIEKNKIFIKKSKFSFKKIACFYTIYAERQDVAKLETEK